MKALAFHPQADEEYAEAVEYYAHINPELGKRFYDHIERLIIDVRREAPRRSYQRRLAQMSG